MNKKWIKETAQEIIDNMSLADIKNIALYGIGPWKESISLMPFWNEDEKTSHLSDEEKDKVLEELLFEITSLATLETIRTHKSAEKCRWIDDEDYGSGAVECYGIMPNSNEEGWYFAGYADKLLSEIQNKEEE